MERDQCYERYDRSCEKCPQGACDRSQGLCIVYDDGYHCRLGEVGVDCNFGDSCFQWNGNQFYSWNDGTADLDLDQCQGGTPKIPNSLHLDMIVCITVM